MLFITRDSAVLSERRRKKSFEEKLLQIKLLKDWMDVKRNTSDNGWEEKELRIALHYRVVSAAKPVSSSSLSMALQTLIRTSKIEFPDEQLIYLNLPASTKALFSGWQNDVCIYFLLLFVLTPF